MSSLFTCDPDLLVANVELQTHINKMSSTGIESEDRKELRSLGE